MRDAAVTLASGTPPQLLPARELMAFTLATHILLVPFGVALPFITLVMHHCGLRRGDPVALKLARRWSAVMAVQFAIGIVTGTVLSFEFGLLWPGMMGRWGDVFGLGFGVEAWAFFLEAVLIAVYLYGWRRLRPWTHFWLAVPLPLTALMGAFGIVAANSWMNTPQGFTLDAQGRPVGVDVRQAVSPADRPCDGARGGGQQRLADLRPGRDVDRVPHDVPGRVHRAVAAAGPRRGRDGAARGGVRAAQAVPAGRPAAHPGRGVRGRLAGHAVLPRRRHRRYRLGAGGGGHARLRGRLERFDVDPRRADGHRRHRVPRRRLPERRRPPVRRGGSRRLLPAAGGARVLRRGGPGPHRAAGHPPRRPVRLARPHPGPRGAHGGAFRALRCRHGGPAAGPRSPPLVAPHRWSRYTSVGTVALAVLAWGFAQRPYLLPTSLTVAQGAGAPHTMQWLGLVTVIAIVLVGPALLLVYRLDTMGRLEPLTDSDTGAAGLPGDNV